MVKFAFRQETHEKWLQDLAIQLGSPLNGNTLTLPYDMGEGTILAHDISTHLSCLIMDFQLKKDLEFHRLAGGREGFSLSFNQVVPAEGDKSPRNNIFLSDTSENLYMKMPAGSSVRRLIIFYSGEIAGKYLPADLLSQLEGIARDNGISNNKYLISLPHRETLKEVFEMKENDQLSMITRLSYIIQLTEKFLHSFLRQEQAATPRALKNNDLESMQHVERILSSKLEGFPSLESLAQEVFMSTSKLKNLFKQVYGYTLYDYYNKSRLQRAKDLLVTGQCSIKQVGSEIGFSNLSHFAKAFKREFGALPRDILRNR